MADASHHLRSHLFMVRVWAEDVGDGQVEWRGRAQHAVTGQSCLFRDWATLLDFVVTTLDQGEDDK